jgi:hypothetical protein
MSTLKVDTITKADGTNSISQDAIITTSSPQLGRRNLIINGAMQVAQRGTSESGVASSATFLCDRFAFISGASSGTYTISQESDAPDGFANSFKTLVTATGSTGGSNSAMVRYKLEGQDLQHLQYGSSGAKQLTLSFWFKTSNTGTYQVNIRNIDSSRLVGATYTVSSADTWEYKTVTFPADTTGTINNDNGESFRIDWWLHSGASYNTGVVPTTWQAHGVTDQAAGLTVDLADTINNYAQITGVQLEVGSVATPFEHRSYGEELALCQRYFYDNTTKNFDSVIWTGDATSGQSYYIVDTFPCTMRTTPSIVTSSLGVGGFDSGSIIAQPALTGSRWYCTCNSSGARRYFEFGYTADAEL